MIRPVILLITAAAVVAAPAGATTAARGWTPTTAATKVRASYTTADTVRLADAQQRLNRDLAAGIPETDSRIVRDRQYVTDAETAARPDKVTCLGVGKTAHRYLKFHCTAHVIGTGEYAADGFAATRRLTVLARPFRIVAGWR